VAPSVTPATDSTHADSAKGSPAAKASIVRGQFTLQVAAYKTKAEADALAKRLKARKLDVRVIAAGKLFRVRIGRYASRAAAVTAQKELKAKKIDAFVTESGPEDK
jgi:cell division protein FtsN